MNKVTLIGRLTRDPELKQTQSGHAVTSFSIAVDRGFKNENGEKTADFINCVAWRSTAEFISRYFTKGRMIAICGSLQTRQYVDQNNNNRTAVEVLVNDVEFCGDKPADGTQQKPQGSNQQPTPVPAPTAYGQQPQGIPKAYADALGFAELSDDEDLPF